MRAGRGAGSQPGPSYTPLHFNSLAQGFFAERLLKELREEDETLCTLRAACRRRSETHSLPLRSPQHTNHGSLDISAPQ